MTEFESKARAAILVITMVASWTVIFVRAGVH
jgi:hypothetical protein